MKYPWIRIRRIGRRLDLYTATLVDLRLVERASDTALPIAV